MYPIDISLSIMIKDNTEEERDSREFQKEWLVYLPRRELWINKTYNKNVVTSVINKERSWMNRHALSHHNQYFQLFTRYNQAVKILPKKFLCHNAELSSVTFGDNKEILQPP
jgi:hypothetical protein